MTWTRLSDNYTDRAEFEDMSLSACYLDVEALVYCNRLLTDGFLSASKLPRITRSNDPDDDMQELIDSGLWEEVEGGFQREWDDQRNRVDVEKERAKSAVRTKRFNESKRDRETRHAAGDHSKCNPEWCSGARGESNGVRNGVGNAPQTRPDQTRPDPIKGEGLGKRSPARPSRGRSAPPEEEKPVSTGLVLEDDPRWRSQESRRVRAVMYFNQQNRLLNAKGDNISRDETQWKAAGGLEKFIASEAMRDPDDHSAW
jgi:hypothetical protein